MASLNPSLIAPEIAPAAPALASEPEPAFPPGITGEGVVGAVLEEGITGDRSGHDVGGGCRTGDAEAMLP